MSLNPDQPSDEFVRQVALSVWPSSGALSAQERYRLHSDICAILAGKPAPTRSQSERESVAAAAARLQGEHR